MKRAAGIICICTVLLGAPALAQQVTGHWEFNDPNDGLKATIGHDGYYFEYVVGPGDPQSVTSFGSTSSFGLPALPGGTGNEQVANIPAYAPNEAIGMLPNVGPNGGGGYLNQYTLVYDVLIPVDSPEFWLSFFNSNECNRNDGDYFGQKVNEDPPIWALGISGQYDGVLEAGQWYRVIVSIDLASEFGPLLSKYVNGELVGEQILNSGVDGRWALYTDLDALPTLLFGDDSGDTAPIYCAAVQFRDYAVDAVEAGTLGAASAAGIPVGSGTQGYWNFRNVNDRLAPVTGFAGPSRLAWFAGCAAGTCPFDLADTTSYGTASSFGVPNLPDGDPHGMRFDAPWSCNGYMLPHGAAANGGGTKVNLYTIIADLYLSYDDVFTAEIDHAGVLLTHSTDWLPLYQNALPAEEDGMLWLDFYTQTIGDDGVYDFTEGWIQTDRWMRVVAVVDTSVTPSALTKYVLLADDTVLGPVVQEQDFEGLDGRRALQTRATTFEDILLAFGDGGIYDEPYTRTGFCSSYQVRDYCMPESEVVALGGPRAAGIPHPTVACRGDTNCDGQVGFGDINPFVAVLASGATPCNFDNLDIDGDGHIDFGDIDPFVELLTFGGGPCP